jgi:hypothetical protein
MPTPRLTEEQMQEAVDALAKHGGNQSQAAESIRLGRSAFQSRIKIAARHGIAPGHFEHGTAPGYLMGKVTVQRAADGTVERTWERQSPDHDQQREVMEAALEAIQATIARAEPLPPPETSLIALVTVYVITDFHLGALAWHKEGGHDWDVGIAERTGLAAMEALSAAAPPSEEGLVVIQGDFTHTDGLKSITPTSGHLLDADSRFGKVVDIAIRMIRRKVDVALMKHRKVRLIICEGNHDELTSLWLRKLFACLYEKEPRVTVENSELPYYAYRFGNVMLAFHHGHLKKNDHLPLLFAAQFSKMWGETTKRYCHTGHRHHVEEKEHSGMTVLQHPTLAARDAYSARGGWINERAAQAITYHRDWGQVGRVMVTPEMIA